MTSYVTPKKGVEFIFYAGLPSVSSSSAFQSNPTIAAGDFKVSIDGGALANLATLPAVTPASSKMVKFTLSTSEMNGDNITIVGSDASGGEWKDILVNIQTSARQIDDLATSTDLATVDTVVDAIKAKTDNLPSDPADASVIAGRFDTIDTNLATVDTVVDSILVDTAEIGAAGAGLTAVPWNASWDAEVQSEVDDALVAQRLDELLNADSDIDGAAPPTVGSVFHELMTKTTGSFTYDQTTDSLEAVRDRGDAAWITATGFSTLSASDVAAAVWNAATASYGSAGSYGLLIETNLDATVSSRLASASYTAPDNTSITAILTDTNELQTDWVNGGRLDNILDARASQTSVDDIPTANENADALLDRSNGVETGITLRQALRLKLAALAGKLSGAATTSIAIRDANDTKDRITATVDADGNRTAVTFDAT